MFMVSLVYLALQLITNTNDQLSSKYQVVLALTVLGYHVLNIVSVLMWRSRFFARFFYDTWMQWCVIISAVCNLIGILSKSSELFAVMIVLSGLFKAETPAALYMVYGNNGYSNNRVRFGIDWLERALLLGDVIGLRSIKSSWSDSNFSFAFMIMFQFFVILCVTTLFVMKRRRALIANDGYRIAATIIDTNILNQEWPAEVKSKSLEDIKNNASENNDAAHEEIVLYTNNDVHAASLAYGYIFTAGVGSCAIAAFHTYTIVFVMFKTTYGGLAVSVASTCFAVMSGFSMYFIPRATRLMHFPRLVNVTAMCLLVISILSWILNLLVQEKYVYIHAILHFAALFSVVHLATSPLYATSQLSGDKAWHTVATIDLALIARYIGRFVGILLTWWSMYRLFLPPYAWMFAFFMASASMLQHRHKLYSASKRI
jgi:hypothetical protein